MLVVGFEAPERSVTEEMDQALAICKALGGEWEKVSSGGRDGASGAWREAFLRAPYLRDTFDVLYRDGLEGRPRMMSLGLHGRIAGRPGRTAGLERFLDHVARHDAVWVATRADIARHWRKQFPPDGLIRARW